MTRPRPRCPSLEPHAAPFTPEDGAYAAIVSEFVGLQRAGADLWGLR